MEIRRVEEHIVMNNDFVEIAADKPQLERPIKPYEKVDKS